MNAAYDLRGGAVALRVIPGALYFGELLGAILMFMGFLWATPPQ